MAQPKESMTIAFSTVSAATQRTAASSDQDEHEPADDRERQSDARRGRHNQRIDDADDRYDEERVEHSIDSQTRQQERRGQESCGRESPPGEHGSHA